MMESFDLSLIIDQLVFNADKQMKYLDSTLARVISLCMNKSWSVETCLLIYCKINAMINSR